jgi:outer membrane lipoprotein-sorting protein
MAFCNGIYLARRAFIAGGVAFAGFTMTGAAPSVAAGPAPQQIADHFAKVRTMTGEFVQFGPRGEQTGGKFFIERPGKIRFNYEKPSPIRVVADGKTVMVANTKLKSEELYPLNKTPLKLLLDDRIDLSGSKVKDVKQDPDLTTIVLGDKSIFGNATIKMMFDPKTFELRQWTITDEQGKDTTVMIFNVQQDVKLDGKIFFIDYQTIRSKQRQSNR